MSFSTVIILVVIGILSGFLSGVVGIGGALIMIPLMIVFLGLSQHEAQGTSLALMLPPIGILAVLNYYREGYIEWKYALIIAFTFIIGGYFGSKLAIHINASVLKKIFGTILFIAAIKMVFSK